jgi:hypothetical protein
MGESLLFFSSLLFSFNLTRVNHRTPSLYKPQLTSPSTHTYCVFLTLFSAGLL